MPVLSAASQRGSINGLGAVTKGAPLRLCAMDHQKGGDDWAIRGGYVSITPLGLRSCIPSRMQTAFDDANGRVLAATGSVITAAAADMGLLAGGCATRS
eukprot:278335-Chlamydomonas_euryale.AAC.6